jgi:hypothetical protein
MKPSGYHTYIKDLQGEFQEFSPTGKVARPSPVPGSEVKATPEQRAYRIALEAITVAKVHDQPTPIWAKGVERDAIDVFIDGLRRRFLETGDPMCACDAYRLARSLNLKLPDWILEWLDRGIFEFQAAIEGETFFEGFGVALKTLPDKIRPAQAFAKAFGVNDSTARKAYDNRGIHFGNHVVRLAWQDHQDGRRVKEMAIVRYLSEKYGFSSPETAWRSWARFKRCFPEKIDWITASTQRSRRRCR